MQLRPVDRRRRGGRGAAHAHFDANHNTHSGPAYDSPDSDRDLYAHPCFYSDSNADFHVHPNPHSSAYSYTNTYA